MIELKDQMNRTIRLVETPKRIVSLVPSQTELLFDLGCDTAVVGITKFCIYPNEWFRSKTRVGGTKNVNFQKIEALNPDLIIANKEENSREDIERLAEKYPVYISDIFDPTDAFGMMQDLGLLLNKKEQADRLVSQLKEDLKSIPQMTGSVLYFIWKNPYMVAGKNTYINSILELIGLENAIEDETSRYPDLSIEEIVKINPTHIFLSSEPYPFKEEDIAFLTDAVGAKVQIVEGEIFSWYGSRMLGMKAYFQKLVTF